MEQKGILTSIAQVVATRHLNVKLKTLKTKHLDSKAEDLIV